MEFAGRSYWRKKSLLFYFTPGQLYFILVRIGCHLFSDIFYVAFVYIWPYRKVLILKNTEKSFPHYSNSQKRQFLRKYYRHLADLITEPFLLSLCPERELHRLVRYENLSLVRNFLIEGKDVVLMAAHCGNWEYLLTLPLEIEAEIFAAYSPVSQRLLNNKLKSMRSRFGIKLIPKKDWYRQALKQEGNRPAIFLSVTDQRPAKPGGFNLMFLNQETNVQSGAARIALKRAASVVYVDVKKQSRNSYTFSFKVLSEDSQKSSEPALISAYYQCLENTILRQPELWLWSHNRWKF